MESQTSRLASATSGGREHENPAGHPPATSVGFGMVQTTGRVLFEIMKERYLFALLRMGGVLFYCILKIKQSG